MHYLQQMKMNIERFRNTTTCRWSELFSALTFAMAAMLIMGCEGKRADEPATSTISYELTRFRVESKDGCEADTARCAYYEVSYPVFTGIDTAVANVLMRRIASNVNMGNPEAARKTMQEIGGQFVDDYDQFKKEMPDDAMGWSYEARIDVEVLTDTLLTLSVTENYFTGGAHGGYGKYFININPGTGEDVTLDRFFKPGYNDALRRIADQAFRELYELADTASLQDNMFEFPDDRFELNRNYGFTKHGLVFYYNSYEIAPYAAGPSEVIIPYESLQRLR